MSAKEWLTKSWHNLSTAILLYDVSHYTDIIAVELHYSIEKTLKSFLAYSNQKIPKTHDLIEIYALVDENITIENETILSIATKYHIEESYPTVSRSLPERYQIKEVLDFAMTLFDDVCTKLNIDKNDLINA
ncbi:HEPN domain-containing protein [Sulfuricurvum sp.]|uniref:HEPN domain-containing protein n=1 Tax=Sulfuricurvum sp. TaxID=2025608 RepID=UPI00260C251F|nr:HEPN domain-containing protein [Sulfuricurvum sp.]